MRNHAPAVYEWAARMWNSGTLAAAEHAADDGDDDDGLVAKPGTVPLSLLLPESAVS